MLFLAISSLFSDARAASACSRVTSNEVELELLPLLVLQVPLPLWLYLLLVFYPDAAVEVLWAGPEPWRSLVQSTTEQEEKCKWAASMQGQRIML